jgi:dipeptidyl aminopeptidase/acylaminoacyl peptidase
MTFWLGLLLMCSAPLLVVLFLTVLHVYLCRRYLGNMARIFQEKPLFIIPRGQPVPEAEEVSLRSTNGLTLRGCYLKTKGSRRGVILFGLEFGSNRWSCVPYCQHLVDAGYDVFTLEPRNQGDSESLPGYEPLQWVTDYEVQDIQTAVRYLKGRPDADPRGIGFFGISKGAGAGVFAAARDSYIRCCVTDGMFATYSVVVPYMRQWFSIYNQDYVMQGLLPTWYYGSVGAVGLRRVEKERNCHFPYLERAIRRLAPRPLLMIHGGGDTYIRPEMAKALFEKAGQPREFWLVENAKHNQALQLANGEYRRRVLEFFDAHLADKSVPVVSEPLTSS